MDSQEIDLTLPTDRQVLGLRIRDIRVAQRKTQTELADAIGRKKSTISRIETGESSPSDDTLQRIADALGTTVQLLSAPLTRKDLEHAPLLEFVFPREYISVGAPRATDHMFVVTYRALRDDTHLGLLKGDYVLVATPPTYPKSFDLVVVGAETAPKLARAHKVPTEPPDGFMWGFEPLEDGVFNYRAFVGTVVEIRRDRQQIAKSKVKPWEKVE